METTIKTFIKENKIKVNLNNLDTCYSIIKEKFDKDTLVKDTVYKELMALIFNKNYIEPTKEIVIPTKFRKLHETFNNLCNVPMLEQRSEEWFLQRHNMITASSVADALSLNKYRSRSQFLFEKSLPEPPFQKNIDTHHGCKYEQIATMIYEETYNTCVKEFGLIPHPEISFIGASPDGICTSRCKKNPNKFNEKYGTMLEIKCPRRRQIKKTGGMMNIIPIYYYCQIMIQLEVCKLDNCDFWQCTINEYPSREDWFFDKKTKLEINDTDTIINPNILKGAIIEFLPKEAYCNDEMCLFDAKYIYPPTIDMTCIEYELWINEVLSNLEKNYPELKKDYIFHKIIYWSLDVVHNITVPRDQKWFEDALPKLEQFWKEVLYYRQNPNEIKNILKKKKTSFEDL